MKNLFFKIRKLFHKPLTKLLLRMENKDLYQQHILEHYKHPHNKGILSGATHSAQGTNPSCGDKLTIYLNIENNSVKAASFDGVGCAISVAAASMLTDEIKGKSVDELKVFAPGDIYNMLGVQINPGRVKCALLAYQALSDAIGEVKS